MSQTRVLKFGGKSLSSIEKINRLAQKVSELKSNTPSINFIIVVSAMGQTTSELLGLAKSANEQTVNSNANRELDMLLASGERVSAALFSLALQKYNTPSQSFTGSQAGVLTTGPHSNAFIKEIKPIRIDESLKQNIVPVIAGFQGVDPVTKDVTTLGRGGSDLTACAFADHYKTSAELYKSVGAVHTCDPTIFNFAKPIKEIDYNFLQSMSSWGGQILHDKAADFIKTNQTPVCFYSDDEDFKACTIIKNTTADPYFAIPSLDSVLAIKVENKEIPEALSFLESEFKDASFRVLASAFNDEDSRFLITAPADKLFCFVVSKKIKVLDNTLCAVSLLVNEPKQAADLSKIVQQLSDFKIKRFLETPKRLTFFIDKQKKMELIKKLHSLVF